MVFNKFHLELFHSNPVNPTLRWLKIWQSGTELSHIKQKISPLMLNNTEKVKISKSRMLVYY